MLTDFRQALRPGLLLLLLLTLLCGLLYPLLITGVAQVALPSQANGSLVREGERVVGSALIGQAFASPRYFTGRASAAGDGYDAAASSGSNLGPTSADLQAAIAERVGAVRQGSGVERAPADAVTASGSGLDPHITPANALTQVPRVAAARGLPPAQVRALVQRSVEQPLLGILGEPRVNVLLLNRQLDLASAQAQR